MTSQNYLAILLVIALVVAIRLPIDYRRIMEPTSNDYSTHIYYGLDMLAGRKVPAFTLAHSFWQLGLIFVWWASRSRIDFWQSAIAFQVLSSVASALIIYFWFGALPGRPSPWKRLFWSVTLVIVAPIAALQAVDGAYYFGYIGLANYHNPTVHMLRPFALLMFLLAMDVLECRRAPAWKILFGALVFAAATFLKPSYTVTLLPALGIMALYWLWQRRPIHWPLAFGIGLPSVIILAAQFLITYIQGEPDGGIAFMPFEAARMLSGYLPLKFFLSIFFPLVVALAFWKQARNDRALALAWLSFLMGAIQFYFFIELGSRYTHGNFVWGAQITLFILFVASIRFLLVNEAALRGSLRWGGWLGYAAYLPHIVWGVLYYIFCYTTPHYG